MKRELLEMIEQGNHDVLEMYYPIVASGNDLAKGYWKEFSDLMNDDSYKYCYFLWQACEMSKQKEVFDEDVSRMLMKAPDFGVLKTGYDILLEAMGCEDIEGEYNKLADFHANRIPEDLPCVSARHWYDDWKRDWRDIKKDVYVIWRDCVREK